MRHYYRVDIDCRARELDDLDASYETFDTKTLTFGTIKYLRAFLTKQYAGMPMEPMYDDVTVIGALYYFENSDVSHNPIESWAQCDWVTVTDVIEQKPVGVIFDKENV